MDNVLVDFPTGIQRLSTELREQYLDNFDEAPGIFNLMPPMDGAIESYRTLSEWFDTYILSTAPWENPSAWSDKLLWVKLHLGDVAYKRLILSHNKHLNAGHFLVDDRPNNGAKDFPGEWIHFGREPFEDWERVVRYLENFM